MVAFIAGTLTGIISSWGIGGGTLLMIYMTSFAGIAQNTAQGINLMYFLPTSSAALVSHIKNGYSHKKATIYAVCAGIVTALTFSFVASLADTALLKKLFGVFLLFTGVSEMFRKDSRGTKE